MNEKHERSVPTTGAEATASPCAIASGAAAVASSTAQSTWNQDRMAHMILCCIVPVLLFSHCKCVQVRHTNMSLEGAGHTDLAYRGSVRAEVCCPMTSLILCLLLLLACVLLRVCAV